MILLEYQNIKIFLTTGTLQIDQKTFLWLKKLKRLCHGRVINDNIGEEIVETFYEKELQKTNQKVFRIEKVIKRRGNKLYVKSKICNNLFNSWIDKKDIV